MKTTRTALLVIRNATILITWLISTFVYADTFTVTNLNDSGTGSLRWAIESVNATIGTHTINFSISGTITLVTQLPTVTRNNTVIDASSQWQGSWPEGSPGIILNGTNLNATRVGLTIGADYCHVRGFHITNFSDDECKAMLITGSDNVIGGTGAGMRNVVTNNKAGIRIHQSSRNRIIGNYCGVAPDGLTAGGNDQSGIAVFSGYYNEIGGLTSEERNVVSGNTNAGITISGQYTMVRGNYIGTDKTGIGVIPNGDNGVTISARNNVVGGTEAGARNVISGNGWCGVEIRGATTTDVLIQGNYIGVDATGSTTMGNENCGVYLCYSAHGNTIGGSVAGAGNVLSGNVWEGVWISGANENLVTGNYIGTDHTGLTGLGNGEAGVFLSDGSEYNTIGGETPSERNIISDNGHSGVVIDSADHNTVLGNFIGLDKNGTAGLGNTLDGIDLFTGSQWNVIGGTSSGSRNVISSNGDDGVYISGSMNNSVVGNYIGTDLTGSIDLGNTSGGVFLGTLSTQNTIGGTTAGARNIISGNNHSGVLISGGFGNTVQGNFIGTDVTGVSDLGNTFYGVVLYAGAQNNVIGGTGSGAGNVISGNDASGLAIREANTNNNLVQGNYIGTTADGISARKNEEHGVYIAEGAQSNTIGGTTSGARNIIGGNGFSGVVIEEANTSNNLVQGNYIGLNVVGNYRRNTDYGVYIRDGASNNTIGGSDAGAGNVISCNGQSGIRVGKVSYATVSGTLIQGNLIGTDPTGTAARGNAYNGIMLYDPCNASQVLNNIISCNSGGSGITINSGAHVIKGNVIGTDAGKTINLGNRADGIYMSSDGNVIGGTGVNDGNFIAYNGGEGVEITKANNILYGNTICHQDDNGVQVWSTWETADHNTIGGTNPGEGNVIHHNGLNGILIDGDYDPEGFDSRLTDYNRISGNSIYDNALLGIDLTGSGNGPGITPHITAPVILTASLTPATGILHVEGNGAGALASVEIFQADHATDGEGKTFLGSLAADAGGLFSGDLDVTGLGLTPGENVLATTTHTDDNTSEFSAGRFVTAPNTVISIQNGAWTDGTTWNTGVAPVATDHTVVYEGHTVTVPGSQTCRMLTLKPESTIGLDGSLPATTEGYSFSSSSTTNYSQATGAGQTIEASPAYGTLILSGSGNKSANGVLNISGNMIVSGATTFQSAFPLTVGGDLSLSGSGTFQPSGNTTVWGNLILTESATFNPTGDVTADGSMTLSGSASAAPAGTLDLGGSLTLDGTSVCSPGGTLSTGGGITVGVTAMLNGSTSTISTGGDWTINGTWNPGTSSVVFNDPVANQTVFQAGGTGEEVQVGTGTYNISSNYPFYTFYENNKSQMLYLGSEIGQSGTITDIQFQLSQASPPDKRDLTNFTVRLKETTENNWSSKSNYVDMTGATEVLFQNPYTMPGTTGWFTITLVNPFTYNHMNNLIVEIIWGDNSFWAGYSERYKVYGTSRSYTGVLYGYADSETPPNYDGKSANLPNIRFNFQPQDIPVHFYDLTIDNGTGEGGNAPAKGDPGSLTETDPAVAFQNPLEARSLTLLGGEIQMNDKSVTVQQDLDLSGGTVTGVTEVLLSGSEAAEMTTGTNSLSRISIGKTGSTQVTVMDNLEVTDLEINGGVLEVTAGNQLILGDSLVVNTGGTLKLSGTGAQPVTVIQGSGGYYTFEVNSGGIIHAQHTIFNHMNGNGLNVKNGASVDPSGPFTACTFGEGPAGGVLLTINTDQTLEIPDAVFPENTWGGAYNVRKSVDAGEVTFAGATGSFAGEPFEDDTYGRLIWDSSVPENRLVEGVVGSGESHCYDALNTITVEDFTLQDGADANFIAGQKILFLPGTVIQSGATMHAWITTTSSYCSQQPPMVSAVEGSDENEKNPYEWASVRNVDPNLPALRVYPNPTAGLITLEMREGSWFDELTLMVFNSIGKKMLQKVLWGDASYQCDLSALPDGLYYLRFFSGEEIYVVKVIKY